MYRDKKAVIRNQKRMVMSYPESDEHLEERASNESNVSNDDDDIPPLDELGVVLFAEGPSEPGDPHGAGHCSEVQVELNGAHTQKETEASQNDNETVHHGNADHVQFATLYKQTTFIVTALSGEPEKQSIKNFEVSKFQILVKNISK